MADTVPAMLEPGEYVIRKDAAEEIGIDNLNMMNNIDRSSQMYMNHGGLVPQLQHGHSAIDELLAMNTLSNQANVDMTRQTGMFNTGGQAKPPQDPDPLQINPRMRGEFSDMGTIGIVDPRQELIDNLNTLQNSIRKEQHFKRQGKDAYVKHQKESGELLGMDSIMDILNSGAQQTALMFKDNVQGYNNGGTVGYGDQTSDVMTLEDIYQMTGQRVDDPTGAGLKEYDASREGGALADYSRQVGGLQQQGMGMIGQATQQAQGMGGGFAGFGGRQSAVEQARTQAQRGYQSGIDQAQQNKFETIRSMREGYTADIIGQIGQEEAAGGTTEITEAEYATTPIPTEDPNWNPPTNPTPNATYNFGNQVWQFIRRAGPGGEVGQGQWIRQN